MEEKKVKRTRHVATLITHTEFESLRIIAFNQGVSISTYLQKIIREKIEEKENENGNKMS